MHLEKGGLKLIYLLKVFFGARMLGFQLCNRAHFL